METDVFTMINALAELVKVMDEHPVGACALIVMVFLVKLNHPPRK